MNGDCVIFVGIVTPVGVAPETVRVHLNVKPPVVFAQVTTAESGSILRITNTGATGGIIVDTARTFFVNASPYITCPY